MLIAVTPAPAPPGICGWCIGPAPTRPNASRSSTAYTGPTAPAAAAPAASGPGLAIARALVTAHGGRRTPDTAPGEGCTFRVRLPLSESPSG
ncbi:ATP-binding protein [Kitasatospora cheerisanensis]|uniref:ATP-binding protein n=1 Tax=Kitasatospora cheerisanensis TaxID=81942 RepID=UPI00055FDD9B